MKVQVLLLLFCISFVSAQSEIGVIELKDGSEIKFYDGSNATKKKSKTIRGYSGASFGPFGFNGDKLVYFSQSGEFDDQRVKEIKSVRLRGNALVLLPVEIKRNKFRLAQLIATNENYYLLNFEANNLTYFYITDKNNQPLEDRIIHTASKKKSQKAIAKVKEYFSECTELINGLETNFSKPDGRHAMKRYNLLYHIESGFAINYLNNIDCTGL